MVEAAVVPVAVAVIVIVIVIAGWCEDESISAFEIPLDPRLRLREDGS